MTLRVTNVPSPPPGQEWTFAIPGQYVYDVRAVVATYQAQDASSSQIFHDSSGNAHNGTIDGPDLPSGLQYPGAVSGDAAFLLGTNAPVQHFISPHVGNVAAGGNVFNLQDIFTLEMWVRFPQLGDNHGNFIICKTTGGGETIAFSAPDITDKYLRLIWGTFPGSVRTADATWPDDGAWHYLAATADTGVGHIFLDGVEIPISVAFPSGPSDPNNTNAVLGGTANGTAQARWALDEVAIYEYNLDATQVAAHYAAAAGGFAAYSAAVLADGPEGFYHCDEIVPLTPAARYTGLVVGDGTHVLAAYTSGELSLLTGSVTFVWAPATSNVVVASDRITIGVPPLILPAGYTLGSGTPAIGADDQWSNIAIWWDDALSGQPGYGAYDKYANVLLIP